MGGRPEIRRGATSAVCLVWPMAGFDGLLLRYPSLNTADDSLDVCIKLARLRSTRLACQHSFVTIARYGHTKIQTVSDFNSNITVSA
jgi:hypothetical protein